MADKHHLRFLPPSIMGWLVLTVVAFLLFTDKALAQASTSTVYYTTSGLSSSYYSSSPSPTSSLSPLSSPTTTGWPDFPTVPYTGQSLLVGTCTLPQYTMLYFPGGGSLEVPLIGCSDQRPECCPGIVDSASLSSSGTASSVAGAAATTSEGDQSTTSWTGTSPSPTPTGVVSALSQNPLSVCPSDMVDLDPVCCPIGYRQYGQSIIGNLPCVSTLTSTFIAVPTSVLASISSAVASSLAAETSSTSTTSAPTVVINEVFALGLPCADQETGGDHSSGLSTGAKAGIGAGAGVAGILFILLSAWFIHRHRKHKQEEQAQRAAIEPKHISTSTATTMVPGTPMSHQAAYYQHQQQQPMLAYQQPGMFPMSGYVQPHGFPPTFGYAQPGHDTIQPHYGLPQPVMYPGSYSGHPGSLSPPPPFHTGPEQKPVEVDGGVVPGEPRLVSSRVVELSGSERGANTGSSSGGGWESSTARS